MNAVHLDRISKKDLADLGAGSIGYVRRISSDEVCERFPGAPKLASGIDLWGLFGADGIPLFLSDDRSVTHSKAVEGEIMTVSVH